MRCEAMPQSAHHISALALLGAAIRASGMEQIVTLPREVKDSQVDQTPTQAHPADGGIMGGRMRSVAQAQRLSIFLSYQKRHQSH